MSFKHREFVVQVPLWKPEVPTIKQRLRNKIKWLEKNGSVFKPFASLAKDPALAMALQNTRGHAYWSQLNRLNKNFKEITAPTTILPQCPGNRRSHLPHFIRKLRCWGVWTLTATTDTSPVLSSVYEFSKAFVTTVCAALTRGSEDLTALGLEGQAGRANFCSPSPSFAGGHFLFRPYMFPLPVYTHVPCASKSFI